MGLSAPDGASVTGGTAWSSSRWTPGRRRIERATHVLGYTDGPHGGHAEILLRRGARPPREPAGRGNGGFAIGQARLGPGRIHHCMRLIGMAERGLRPDVRAGAAAGWRSASRSRPRASCRTGSPQSRIRIEQARLLVLKTAWLMDTVGNRGRPSRSRRSRWPCREMATWVIDRAMQAHGGLGVCQDTPAARALRPGADAAPGRRPGRGARDVARPPRSCARYRPA